MPLASTLLVLLNRGADLQITSIVEGQAGHLHQAGADPISHVGGLVPLLADRVEELAGRRLQRH